MMRWRNCRAELTGEPPSPRSGHTAALVNGSLVVVYGGLFEKVFLGDLVVLDVEHSVWFRPECSGDQGSDGSVGPGARAFHCAAALDARLFVFGGRSGRRRLDDFWMLDTTTWNWAQLGGFGDRPPARDFAAAAALPSLGKLVVHGGWDGSAWHSDARVLDTPTLEWAQLPVAPGAAPPPRCGHTATVVETRLLMFGGRSGGAGSFLGDLWALKGLMDDGGAATWTKLVLPGPGPSPRCGHATAAAGTQVVFFGGHGQAGWLTKYDVYHSDVIVLDRKSVQWSRPSLAADVSPSSRAYHTLTHVGGGRFLLLGGYDGKASLGDVWMLTQDDPSARPVPPPSSSAPSSPPSASHEPSSHPPPSEHSSLALLRQQLGLPRVAPSLDRSASRRAQRFDSELLTLGYRILRERGGETAESAAERGPEEAAQAAREYLRNCDAPSLRFADLRALLNDYKRGVSAEAHASTVDDPHQRGSRSNGEPEGRTGHDRIHRFYHVASVRDVKLEDVPVLLQEYKALPVSVETC